MNPDLRLVVTTAGPLAGGSLLGLWLGVRWAGVALGGPVGMILGAIGGLVTSRYLQIGRLGFLEEGPEKWLLREKRTEASR